MTHADLRSDYCGRRTRGRSSARLLPRGLDLIVTPSFTPLSDQRAVESGPYFHHVSPYLEFINYPKYLLIFTLHLNQPEMVFTLHSHSVAEVEQKH